jgi:hypothetical protein
MRAMPARRSTASSRLPLILGAVILVLALAGGGFLFWKSAADKAAATAKAKQEWVSVRQVVVTRLNQPAPIELGAVWAMHGGRICGLVNGKGSFGGLTGMTPFYAEGTHVVFSFDQDSSLFGRVWLDCSGDMYVPLVAGTTTEGFCGTKAGAVRCKAAGVKSS